MIFEGCRAKDGEQQISISNTKGMYINTLKNAVFSISAVNSNKHSSTLNTIQLLQ